MIPALRISLIALCLIVFTSAAGAACRAQRARNVHAHAVETKIAIPFAVPVAVPVAVVSPYFYSYSQFADDQRTAAMNHHAAAEAASQPAQVAPQAVSHIATHCATCHGRAAPQGGLSLDNPQKLSLADRLAAIRAVLSRRMPKGAKLDDAQLRGVIDELSSYE